MQHEPMDVDLASNDTEPTDVTLPMPGPRNGQKSQNGKEAIQYLDIQNADRQTLVGWCKSYGLQVSGNKAVLKDRLREFSQDRDRWDILKPKTRRMHRGAQSGGTSKSARKKQSSRRADALFDVRNALPQPHMPLSIPLVGLPVQGLERREVILKWAAKTVQDHPYVNKDEREQAAQERMKKNHMPNLTGSFMESTTDQLNQISVTIAGLAPLTSLSASTTSQNGISSISPATPPSALLGISPLSSQPPTTACSLDLAHANLPAASVDRREGSHERTTTRSLTLHGGRVLEFSKTDVKSPPAVSFATELPLLDAMWDDESPHWCERSYLVIKGVPIPVKYWKDVYTRTGQWKTIKGNWSQWKAIVERWRQSTEEDFWLKFSDADGNRLSYTAIVKRLADLRLAEDERVAALAKEKYGDEFASIFTYKKCGKNYVKRKSAHIAKQYRELTGMPGDDDE